MKVHWLFAGIAVLLSLGACDTGRRFAITGQTASGSPASGEVVAMGNGAGTVTVKFPAGLRCKGEYDWRDRKPVFTVPLDCGNGIRGEGVVKRYRPGIRGMATVSLNNGVSGRFVYGAMTFEEAYGEPR